jgi:hypothetical protein
VTCDGHAFEGALDHRDVLRQPVSRIAEGHGSHAPQCSQNRGQS